MPSKTCEQCGKKFTAATEGRAVLALNMHVGRVHKRTIIAYNGKHPTGIVRAEDGGGVAVLTRSRLQAVRRGEPVKAKRLFRRKIQQEVRVNFCPQCGCNIHAVAVGIATARL